jgi:hypothetical protein
MTLLITVGSITDQDLSEPVDLFHHTVDLSVLLAADRDVGQRSREEMEVGRRDSRSLSATSRVMRRRDFLE